jgi:hypothetical protein
VSRRRWLILLLLGALMTLFGAIWVSTPGYMDADYYFAVGQRLAHGDGFTEPFIWTYATDPAGIMHPSNLYWMPFTSILAALPMSLFGVSFRIAQLPFLLLAALLPVGAARLSLDVFDHPDHAWRAGWLAAFSGFFFPYFLTTDMFILYAWLGLGIFYILGTRPAASALWRWFLIGVFIGLAHLARADGWLFFLPALTAVFVRSGRKAPWILMLVVGYLLPMGPWFLRNLSVAGSPLAPGVGRSLWLTSYPQFFSYPPELITFQSWLDAGIGQAALVRFEALGVNLERAIAENGLVFLVPFIIWGAYIQRRKLLVRSAGVYALAVLGLMSVVFPFAGMNGGVFHSSAALMPIVWCLAPVGLEQAIEWGVRRRGWELNRARSLFHPSAIGLAALFTLVTMFSRAIGSDPTDPRWNWPQRTYREVGDFMADIGAGSEPVAINNPPGYWVATGNSAIVIPGGGPESLLQALQRYDVEWVILDANHPVGLRDLYEGEIPTWLEPSGELKARDGTVLRMYQLAADGSGS